MHEHWNESQGLRGKAEDDVDSGGVVMERAAGGQRRGRAFVGNAPIDNIEHKSEAMDVSQLYFWSSSIAGRHGPTSLTMTLTRSTSSSSHETRR